MLNYDDDYYCFYHDYDVSYDDIYIIYPNKDELNVNLLKQSSEYDSETKDYNYD